MFTYYFQLALRSLRRNKALTAPMVLAVALGIVGLASFRVPQRRRTIGVRRALGASRGDILGCFQTENFLIATAGIVLGMLLAYGLNLFLMAHYELPRLPVGYLPAGALALWLLGHLAVFGPALRGAGVPPDAKCVMNSRSEGPGMGSGGTSPSFAASRRTCASATSPSSLIPCFSLALPAQRTE